MRRRIYGDHGFPVAETLNDLGLGLDAVGRTDEAMGMVQEALEIHRAVLGEEHPDSLHILDNVAAMYRDAASVAAIPRVEELQAFGCEQASFAELEAHGRRVEQPVYVGSSLVKSIERLSAPRIAWLERSSYSPLRHLTKRAQAPDCPRTEDTGPTEHRSHKEADRTEARFNSRSGSGATHRRVLSN